MAWYPTRISTRLTIGGILLLAVTTLVIVAIMLWRGQPRVVEINTDLIEETGQGLTRQLSTVLSRIEGETVSLSRLAEVLPNDESLYQRVVPHLIGEDNNSIIPAVGFGQNLMRLPLAWRSVAFSGRETLRVNWIFPMIIMQKDLLVITMKAGTNMRKVIRKTVACGLMFIRIQVLV